jgi:3-methyladenine DNA glycosylase AlkD
MKSDPRTELRKHASPEDAKILQRFFKTGPGEYGEGDIFIGVRVPVVRRIARTFKDAPVSVLLSLLKSGIHEERLLALIMLVDQFRCGTKVEQKEIYKLYLEHREHINNWDLIDTSAEHIVGAYLHDKSRKPLYQLAGSESLWDRRIAIMSTFHFIKKNKFDETLKLAALLLDDDHDLIHKATGWMLREVGNRHRQTEEVFLKKHLDQMPRTMLRYAIEKFPEPLRQGYLKGSIKH